MKGALFMNKKFHANKMFFVLLLMTAIAFASMQNAKVSAADRYAGTYPSGLHAYVMTETVVMGSPGFRRFDVTVKAVNSRGKLVSRIKYHFWNDVGEPVMFSNSEGYRGTVNASTPVEQNIWNIAQPISAEMWNRQISR